MAKHLSQQRTDRLDSCVSCLKQTESWRMFRGALKRTHLQSAPASMLAYAIDLFYSPFKTATRRTVRQIIASLIFDSFAQPRFAGARGELSTRQVVLRAEEFDIHVRIWEADQSRELLGQIQCRRTTSFVNTARLHLLRDGERISTVHVNELGEFHFPAVPTGYLSLQVDLPHLTVIGALDLHDRS
jgi:hypothetical protein